jgi:glutamate-ammonia-ligase adenylyltransferase
LTPSPAPRIAAEMDLATHLTRMPRPFDSDRGKEARALFPELSGDLADLVAGAGGSAPYLLGLLSSEREWMQAAWEAPQRALVEDAESLKDVPLTEIGSALRQSKRRMALVTALMDLGGIWSLEGVTGALTDFADTACDLALRAALHPQLRRGKVPGHDEGAIDDAAGMVILAMGKMGARELNYSSDIDLICLFDQDRFERDDFHDARTAFVRTTRTMAKLLSDVTAEGYVFRTDLRLRPDPAVTPVCIAMEAAENYYESLGRTWERAAYIKARPAAGDLDAGDRFLELLRPFVWRKHLDYAAIEDAHNMRLAIREHKGLGGPITLPGHDMKLGRGGIREIEFYTQTRQLIAGGRDPSLRVRGTVEGLERLAKAGWVPADVAESLSDHYRFHRTVEHRLQMVQDSQTQHLPQTEAEFDRLACLMGMDTSALRDELYDRLKAVHLATEGFFAPQKGQETAPSAEPVLTEKTLTRWSAYPALRSSRARLLLDRLRPELDKRLSQAARPEEALTALDGFLAGLPAGVQLLALFEANPQLIDLVLDTVSTSPALAEHLSRNAQVLDAVIGGGFFEDWPGDAGLEKSLRQVLEARTDDYEFRLDATRRWMKEWHFRVGVHLLRGLITAEEAGTQYADLARAVLRVLWPEVQTEFARRHGQAPGRGAVLLGMGALGQGQMNPRSDLDLIVIYDAEGSAASEGRKPLTSRPYFARLTQALITAVSAQMSEGRLYEVDMRLRPSGNQGPVATSWASFQTYQSEEAWTWEHLALTRAHVVAGPEDLARDVEVFRARVLKKKRNAAKVAAEVQSMRDRITKAKPPAGWLDIKAGAGQMQDIELLAQTGLLLAGRADSGVQAGLDAVRDLGAIDTSEDLAEIHDLYWRVQVGGRLLGPTLSDAEGLGDSGRDFLLRLTEKRSLADLRETLDAGRQRTDVVITDALRRLGSGTGNGKEG